MINHSEYRQTDKPKEYAFGMLNLRNLCIPEKDLRALDPTILNIKKKEIFDNLINIQCEILRAPNGSDEFTQSEYINHKKSRKEHGKQEKELSGYKSLRACEDGTKSKSLKAPKNGAKVTPAAKNTLHLSDDDVADDDDNGNETSDSDDVRVEKQVGYVRGDGQFIGPDKKKKPPHNGANDHERPKGYVDFASNGVAGFGGNISHYGAGDDEYLCLNGDENYSHNFENLGSSSSYVASAAIAIPKKSTGGKNLPWSGQINSLDSLQAQASQLLSMAMKGNQGIPMPHTYMYVFIYIYIYIYKYIYIYTYT
jgi:hypothetical protein